MPSVSTVSAPVVSDLFRGLSFAETPAFHAMRPTSHWHTILESYTKGNLTKPTDKLIAIAGVAKTFQMRYGGDYMAGLWRHEMPYSLLWFVKGSKMSGGQSLHFVERVKPYRAPSWSWCAVDGCIQYVMMPKLEGTNPMYPKGKGSVDLATIVDVKVTTVSGDPFGQVTDGAIEMTGVLIPATKETTLSAQPSTYSTGTVFPRTDRDEFTLEADPSVDLSQICYLPLAFGGDWLHGLLLCRDISKADGYIRAGVFMFGDESLALLGVPEDPLTDLSNWPPPKLFVQRIKIY